MWATSQLFSPNSNVPFSNLREADSLQHFPQLCNRYSWLVLVKSEFIIHHADASEDLEDRIHEGTRPGHDQRTSGPQQAVSLGQDFLGFLEMFQHGEHGHVIELAAFQRQAAGYICAHYRYFCLWRIRLRTRPDPHLNSGAIQCTEGRALPRHNRCRIRGIESDVRGGSAKTPPCHETVKRSIGHLFLELGSDNEW